MATYVYSPVYIDEVVAMLRAGQEFYLHQNAQADVVAVADAGGAVIVPTASRTYPRVR